MKHNNISIFIPHTGCPHMCSFCNQRTISGTQKAPSPDEVRKICEKAYNEIPEKSDSEIAFFGGSFTAIPENEMLSYLEAVQPFLGEKGFSGIRISTRPDALPEDTLVLLKKYGVTAIELGAQSMSDRVLQMNRRGHTAEDIRQASERIKSHGFSLGLQMMYGLYGSTAEDEEYTLSECISLRPDTMRIYPVVVLEGTHLGELYKTGEYILPSWENMLEFVSHAICRLKHENIALIRCGLHAEKGMECRILGGFYHPSLKELVLEKLYLRKMLEWAEDHSELLRNRSKGSCVIAEVRKGDAGLVSGHNRANRLMFSEKACGIRLSIAENADYAEGILKLCLADKGITETLGEEVYDVFKITGTTGL